MNLRQTQTVSLPPSAEKYIEFARFCSSYRVSPRELAEVIQLVNKCKTLKSLDKRQVLGIEIVVRLRQAGFTTVQALDTKGDVDVKMNHPSRKDTEIRLPLDKF